MLVAAHTDIEDILKFVDWLDSQLSSLVNLYLSLFSLSVLLLFFIVYTSLERASFKTKYSGCSGPYHVLLCRRFMVIIR